MLSGIRPNECKTTARLPRAKANALPLYNKIPLHITHRIEGAAYQSGARKLHQGGGNDAGGEGHCAVLSFRCSLTSCGEQDNGQVQLRTWNALCRPDVEVKKKREVR